MTITSLFNQDELQLAFEVLVPRSVARELAIEWFGRLGAEDTDEDGRFRVENDENDQKASVDDHKVEERGDSAVSLSGTHMIAQPPFKQWTRSAAKHLLLSFSGLHIDLFLLAVPNRAESVAALRGSTAEKELKRVSGLENEYHEMSDQLKHCWEGEGEI